METKGYNAKLSDGCEPEQLKQVSLELRNLDAEITHQLDVVARLGRKLDPVLHNQITPISKEVNKPDELCVLAIYIRTMFNRLESQTNLIISILDRLEL